MTTGAPAGASGDKPGVIETSDHQASGSRLLLHMAFQTKSVITLGQQFRVDGAVDCMAGGASLADGFMLEDEWP